MENTQNEPDSVTGPKNESRAGVLASMGALLEMVALVDVMLGKRPVETTVTQVHPRHAMSQFAWPDSVAPLPWPALAKFSSDAYLKMWRQYHPPLREMAHSTPQFLTIRSVLWKAIS